ncbi:MAG: nitroreductase family protein [Tepidanaerobacteraceae bacterium]|jgi:nitroreductase|nr:nitroreductase family protein [Tepidanaerobacteraceae bacterium]
MNETIRNILERRSIRAYRPEQIKDEERDIILQAAMHAPSAMGKQPWHFTVIQRKDIIDAISEGVKKAAINRNIPGLKERVLEPGFHALYAAPTAIIISGDKTSKFVYADCAAAAENILIAAQSLGIGTCFIAMTDIFFSTEEGRKFAREIGIPECYEPIYTVAVGYKACDAPQPAPRKENAVTILRQGDGSVFVAFQKNH